LIAYFAVVLGWLFTDKIVLFFEQKTLGKIGIISPSAFF